MAKKKKYAVLPDGRRIEVTGMSSQQTKKLNKKATTYEAPVKEVKITDKSDMGPVRTTVTTEADRTNMSLLEKMKYGIEKNPWMPHGSLPDIYRAPSTDGRTWFDKGALDDGYQLGDITKTILGTGADVAENVSTAVMGMGEKAADFMTYLAPTLYATQQAQTGQVVDLSAQDKMRKDAGELIKKDLYNEEKIAKTIITKPLQKVGIDAENESVFGEKSDALIQSAGQLLATAGLQAVGVPWWLTTGTTSFGSETENALNQGATYEEAGASALISAGAEILTEQLSGGISFGGKTLDDVLTKQLATKISSKTARHLAKFGLDAFGEGTEEVVSQIFSNLGSSLYKEEDTWELLTNEDAMEEYLESFIGGAVLGGGSSGINIIKNAKKGTDAVTGLNANEQKVADKEIENRIKESEKDGKKLSSKEKAKIRNQVYNDLDKGYISIDTIESVLGGDTYNKYRELNDRETSLQEEFDHLNKMKQGDMTGEQVDRRTELKQQLADLKASSEKGQIKDQLTKEVQEMVKSDRLMESYNEKTRRSQAYEADITKYDEKQQAVIKKAAESGILNNTNRTHEFVDMIAKISADKGVLFDFTNNEKIKNSGFAMEGKTVNGYIKDGAVTLNINSAKALNKVVGHEITHVLEGTELYSELQNAVKSYAETKGEYNSRLESIKALYKDVEGANVENELTADLVGDYLFTDENFVSNLSAKNPNIFKKIYDEIKYLVKVVTAGSKEARELEKVKRTFEKAYKETANAQSGTKYMLQKEVKNVAERLSGREWNQVKEAVSNYNNLNHSYEKSSDGDIIIPVNNKLVYTDGDYDSPGINKVIEFDSDTETEIDEARRLIYGAEKGKYTLTDAYEVIEAFTRDGFINEYSEKGSKSGKRYDRRTGRGKSRSDSYHAGFLQERIGRANEIIGNVNNSQEASSEGDVFFDGEKKTKFSLAGTESRTADTHSLTMARQMAENGDSELEVYQKTGWYQGADGKWRFEIDDSEMKVDTSGKYSRNPDIRRYQELMEKVYFSDTGTKVEENELRALDKNLKGVSFEPKKLDEIMQHPKLFEAYPELREIDVRFVKKDGFLAAYHPGFDEIAINTSLRLDKEKLRKAITHEVQHAIQTIEGFAGGANTETWNGHIIPKNDSENLTDFEKYEMTAGEIEAREAAKRMDWSKEERLSEIPTRETEHGVIFAENKDNPFEFPDKKTKYSISEDDQVLTEEQEKLIRDTIEVSFSKNYGKDTYTVLAYDKNDKATYVNHSATKEELSKYFGTEIAEEISRHMIELKNYKLDEKFLELPANKDSEGRALSKEQKEYFKNVIPELKDDNGNLKVLYHGTPNDFTQFNYDFIESNGTALGKGFYLTDSKDVANGYTGKNGKVMELYAVIEKPLSLTEKNIKKAQYKKFVKAVDKATKGEYLSNYGEVEYEGYNTVLNRALEDFRYDDNDVDLIHGVLNASGLEWEEGFRLLKKTLGYDGVIQQNFNGTGSTVFIPTLPEQIKSVTNTNPTNNPDINLSLSKDDIAPTGNYNVYGKDIALEQAAVQEDIAPVRSNIETKKTHTEAVSLTEEETTPVKVMNEEQALHSLEERQKVELEELDAKVDGVDVNEQPELSAEENYNAMVENLKECIANYKQKRAEIEENFDRAIQNKQDELTLRQSNNDSAIKGLQDAKIKLEKSFDEKIKIKETEYNALKRKDTKKAGNILTQIENLKSRKANSLTEIDAKIRRKSAVVKNATGKTSGLMMQIENLKLRKKNNIQNIDYRLERAQEMLDGKIEGRNKEIKNIESRIRFKKRQSKQQEYRTLINDLIGDTSTWKDKKTGIQYQVNTLQRNLRDIVRDDKGNKDIARADAIYDELQGKYNLHEAELNRESNAIKKVFSDMNINDAEDTYIQMLGEFRHNPATTLTQEDIDAFYNKYKRGIDVDKVNTAIDSARELYDSLFVRLNEVLSEQGMKEIPYRKGYFPHFIEDKQGIIAKIFNWKVSGNDIPTDIAGLTETFNPQRSWQSFNKRRTTDDTDYSFKKGLDTYLHGALDWIYHIEDIQKRRVFEQEIRYRHSEKGLQEEIDNIRNNPLLSAEEAQKLIDDKFAEARNPLNNFITDFRNATNNLAGKKSTADRGMEYMTNRTIYSVMTNVSNRVNANMVGGSVSSALTNFIPIVQSWGAVNPVDSLVAMKDTMKAFMKDDGMIDKSAFMTNRLNASENLYKSGWDRFIDKAGFMMEAIDSFTTQTVWRSKYAQNIKEGMSEQEAIKNADRFAEGVMAGRSRGNMPTIFNSKNPLTKLFTSFQLEAANQFGYLFKDLPQDVGRKSIGKLAAGYATVLIASRAYNMLYSMLTGRDAALDPLGILEELWSDLGSDDEEKEKKALLNLGENVVEELPFIGGLFGGGRTPISSAIPYDSIDKAIPGMIEDVSDGNWSNLGKEWLNPVYYLGAPVLGGQIKKINEGLGMFNKKHPVPGSYTQSGNLRFPVEDTLLNRAQAAVFGQYANKNARYYFDNNIAPLKEKQIEEYKELDVPIKEYWDYREGLKEQKKTEDKFDYIADLDLPISKKNIMINNAVNRKEKVDLTDYHKFEGYEEFDFYTKNKEKYEFLKENNISYEEYQATDEAKENYDDIYSWYKNNPDKVAVSKAVTSDVVSYKGWTKELYDIRADKDSNGKSISGTAKEKKIDYINGLDIDYGAKLVLFKSQYKADDTYNSEIIDYLNEREDISAKERKTILKELGFTVDSKGNARW